MWVERWQVTDDSGPLHFDTKSFTMYLLPVLYLVLYASFIIIYLMIDTYWHKPLKNSVTCTVQWYCRSSCFVVHTVSLSLSTVERERAVSNSRWWKKIRSIMMYHSTIVLSLQYGTNQVVPGSSYHTTKYNKYCLCTYRDRIWEITDNVSSQQGRNDPISIHCERREIKR